MRTCLPSAPSERSLFPLSAHPRETEPDWLGEGDDARCRRLPPSLPPSLARLTTATLFNCAVLMLMAWHTWMVVGSDLAPYDLWRRQMRKIAWQKVEKNSLVEEATIRPC